MQGDVLSPLVSSNMVDKHIGKKALETGNVYLYKNKVINFNTNTYCASLQFVYVSYRSSIQKHKIIHTLR